MRTAATAGVGVLAAAAAAQVVPAGSWLPGVRQFFPALCGAGRPDHVALTFDDGPDPVSTPHFLDALEALDVRATFFVVGEHVQAAPALARRIVEGGHELGIHAFRHRYTFTNSPRLARCIDVVEDVTGVRPLWFRPPYGVLSATAYVEARRHGLRPVLWTAWARDWERGVTTADVLRRIDPGITGGATLLLHDGSECTAPGAWRAACAALPEVVGRARARGLAVGPLREHAVRPRRRERPPFAQAGGG